MMLMLSFEALVISENIIYLKFQAMRMQKENNLIHINQPGIHVF